MKSQTLFVASTALIGGAGSLAAFLYTPIGFALGVALGVFFAVGNLLLLGRIVPTVLAPSPLEEATPERKRFWGFVAVFKFLAMMLVVSFALRTGIVDALGIAIGTFALPAGLAISALL